MDGNIIFSLVDWYNTHAKPLNQKMTPNVFTKRAHVLIEACSRVGIAILNVKTFFYWNGV